MWFIGVEVEQETSAPPPKKNPGSAPGNYRKKIGFSVCKKENFAGLQAHRKRGKSARASPTPHHTLNEERSARFTAQHLSALLLTLHGARSLLLGLKFAS